MLSFPLPLSPTQFCLGAGPFFNPPAALVGSAVLPVANSLALGRLELGAGGGVVGLTVARGCASLDHPLFITDMVEMESLMQHNISLNGLDNKVRARVLNW